MRSSPRVVLTTATLLTAALLTAGAVQLSAQEERTHVRPAHADDPDALPFSEAVKVGNTLYLSGMIGLDEDGDVPPTAEAEARNVMEQMRSVVEEAGMTMDDLVLVKVFCSDVDLYDAFNDVYRDYFEGAFPARAFIGSGRLLFDARFEVQAIAVGR